MKLTARIFAIVLLAAVAGCHELGHIDGIDGYGGAANTGREVVGEVEVVDSRAREIEVRTDSGRTAVLRYDDGTQVIYRQRNYSPANLERGDYITARVQQDRDGQNYADTITVRESVQERSGYSRGGGNRLDRVEGKIEYIDARRGTFELRDSRNRLIVVSVPFNAPREVIDRFNRLREGDYVRIEGRSAGSDRFELEAFV
jgi:hypothetical protein